MLKLIEEILNPTQWDRELSDAWHKDLPDVNSCWVDCNKRLPDLIKDKDYSENVLAWCGGQLMVMCLFWVNGVDEHDSGYIWCQSYYLDGEGQSDDDYAPTHWMPLPKEPSVC